MLFILFIDDYYSIRILITHSTVWPLPFGISVPDWEATASILFYIDYYLVTGIVDTGILGCG